LNVFENNLNYDQKSSPTHFSDESNGPLRKPFSPEAALLQEEMGDISPVLRQVRRPKAQECCTQISNRTPYFRPPWFFQQRGGSKKEATPGRWAWA
jgi:hypothetical protein